MEYGTTRTDHLIGIPTSSIMPQGNERENYVHQTCANGSHDERSAGT